MGIDRGAPVTDDDAPIDNRFTGTARGARFYLDTQVELGDQVKRRLIRLAHD